MTTVVLTTEDNPWVSIVRHTSVLALADDGPEVAEPQVAELCREAQECIEMSRWLHLASLMLTSADLIFSRASEKDLECIYTMICDLVKKTVSPEEEIEMAEVISTKVTQQPNDRPALRLKILFNLFNLLETPYSRFSVYMKILDVAVKGRVPEPITPSFKKIDSFMKEWNLGTLDQRALFLAISRLLKENKSSAKDSFYFLTKYLATFQADDGTLSEAKEEAVNAIIAFVKAPDVFQCNLLDLPAIEQLENDEKYASVYQLLKIFLTERLHAYLEFQASNSTMLKSHGLLHEDCVTKMRLMSLVDLGSSASGEIPYDLIKETLQVTDEEVEQWVVKAIAAKLLHCKMDQLNESVIVSRSTERVFGQHEWQSLRSKLAMWRGNIANVLTTIQANKASEDASQAAQGLMTR